MASPGRVIRACTPFCQSVGPYELSRAGFLALEIGKTMLAKEAFSDADERFLVEFRAERALKVDKAIKAAIAKAKTVTGPALSPLTTSWEELVEPCPVCRAPALFRGESVLVGVEGIDGRADRVALAFLATAVECPHCGLKLEDGDELVQAGIDPEFDRPDADVQKFLVDQGSAGTISDPTGRDLMKWQVTADGPHRRTMISVLDFRRTPRRVAQAMRQAIDEANAATPHPVKARDDDAST